MMPTDEPRMTREEWREQERRECMAALEASRKADPNYQNLLRGIGCRKCGAQGAHDFCVLPLNWFREPL